MSELSEHVLVCEKPVLNEEIKKDQTCGIYIYNIHCIYIYISIYVERREIHIVYHSVYYTLWMYQYFWETCGF